MIHSLVEGGDKERDLLRMLEKRAEAQANEGAEGQTGEGAGTDLELDAHVGSLLTNQFKDTWANLLPNEQWYEYKDHKWGSPTGWSYKEMLNKIEEEMKKSGALLMQS